jgi:hypothetical protein
MGWFFGGGCVGILVALVLGEVASHRSLDPTLVLTLWPFSIVGIADPTGFWNQALFAVIEFGGNFLLYGIVGTGLGIVVRKSTGSV